MYHPGDWIWEKFKVYPEDRDTIEHVHGNGSLERIVNNFVKDLARSMRCGTHENKEDDKEHED